MATATEVTATVDMVTVMVMVMDATGTDMVMDATGTDMGMDITGMDTDTAIGMVMVAAGGTVAGIPTEARAGL